MNRLWVRLTLAFVLVTLAAVGTVALLATWSATQAFGSYVARQTEFVQSGNLEALAGYYARADSWAGVEAFLAELGLTAGRGRNRPALLLADAQARVVFDERGQRVGSSLTNDEFTRAVPVVSQGASVGYVVFNAAEGGAFTPAQQAFITQLQSTFAIAALVAGLLGIGLGAVVSRSLAAPLGQMAAAARGLAERRWDQRAPVTGADEVADVGRAFNAMAESLQKAEALRRSLMADIAHELRTPLTVMQGNLRAILDGVYPLEVGEIVTLYDETRFLSRLVDDLRELALADAGQPSLQSQTLDAAGLVRRLQAQFAAGADAAEVSLQTQLPPAGPPVQADADRAAQVLRNLIANALRHTPAGGQVTISVEPAPAGAVRFSVRDTGAGIPPADQPHVFERFYRGDNARAGGGLGLGLAIAKAWVEAMGGQIGLESEVGRGSCFWFTLPAAR
ncbi:MAG: HAMP domain-containing histidine kinase [Anaerolineales bacterium]|nr:HAMP domain-containing histidine kinase [Anaerolineales bacterium]